MCIYHRNNGEFEDAITFAKSSVISMLKICGSIHPKVGECYYHLAVCCIKANKKEQALVSLQKAKTIFEHNHKQKDVAYAHVCLKLGLLFLSEDKAKEAANIIRFALSNFTDHMR
jgi:tetratricopeptide (TPR) repeat protein